MKVEVFEIVTLVSRGKTLTGGPTNVFITTNNPEADDTTGSRNLIEGPRVFS